MRKSFLLAAASVAIMSPARAQLVVSSAATENVTCSGGGVCKATAKNAVLNASELATMLDSGDVTIRSGAKAKDIDVEAGVEWSSAHVLTLDSYRAIKVDRTVTVGGSGASAGVTLTTNDGSSGGGLNFGPTASIGFADDTNSLVINGASYHLVFDYPSLSLAIFEFPGGNVALGGDLDMSGGAIEGDPISQMFTGTLEGLGHRILYLQIYAIATIGEPTGFFYGNSGSISDLRIPDMVITNAIGGQVGGLAGLCYGPVTNVFVSGHIKALDDAQVGGLCGVSNAAITGSSTAGTVRGGGRTPGNVGGLVGDQEGGTILNSRSSATVKGNAGWTVGGLVGSSAGAIVQSYATGTVGLEKKGLAGGLVGANSAAIQDSYATGSTTGGAKSAMGGLIGQNNGPVSGAYASGAVAGGSGSTVGGLVGNDVGSSDLADTYWDTDTSGQSHGVGNNTAYPGVTGLTTAQFQSGLPAGFHPRVWAEDPDINGGFPYLLENYTPDRRH